MMTTYYAVWELMRLRSVSNREIDDLFQEVRSKVTNRIFIKEIKMERKVWRGFRRIKVETVKYDVINALDPPLKSQVSASCECQVLMHLTGVTPGHLYSYLVGLLTGYEQYEKQVEKRRSKYGI